MHEQILTKLINEVIRAQEALGATPISVIVCTDNPILNQSLQPVADDLTKHLKQVDNIANLIS